MGVKDNVAGSKRKAAPANKDKAASKHVKKAKLGDKLAVRSKPVKDDENESSDSDDGGAKLENEDGKKAAKKSGDWAGKGISFEPGMHFPSSPRLEPGIETKEYD